MQAMLVGVLFAAALAHAQQMAQPDAGGAQVDYHELGSARLLVSKTLQSQYAVEGMEFVIHYTLYNLGDKPATKVQLDDAHSFGTQYFDILSGSLKARWGRIAPGANVTHAVILRPLEVGSFNVSSAYVQYYATESEDGERTAYSSNPGEIIIYRQKDYERKFSPHYVDWAVFWLMAAPCIGLPAFLWWNTAKKYENNKGKKQK